MNGRKVHQWFLKTFSEGKDQRCYSWFNELSFNLQ